MSKAKLYLQYENQNLVLGPHKKPLENVLKSYEGPTYVYDLDILRDRFALMQKALAGVELFYAMKANSHPQVLRELQALGAGVDVVSAGEIRRAQEAGFAPSKMIYSGVGKTFSDLRFAIGLGLKQINVESIPELQRIAQICQELNKKISVVFRLNPDVDIKTHPYIATGLHNNKFGMAFGDLPELKTILKSHGDRILFRGVSLHLGSQMHDLGGFRDAMKLLRPVYEDLQKEFSSVDLFDIGGGLGIFYDRHDPEAEEELLADYATVVKEELKGLRAQLQSEPGRWLVGHMGVLLTQVQYLKKTSVKNFVIVDTGMHHLLRPTLYGAYHAVWPVKQKPGAQKVYDVVGPICESGDFLASNRDLPAEIKELEFLAIGDVGAYGFAMRSDYNLQEPPREIFI